MSEGDENDDPLVIEDWPQRDGTLVDEWPSSPELRPPAHLGGREWFAIIFASVVLLVIAITLAVILINGYQPVPDLSKIPLSDQKDVIEQFKALNEVLKQRTEYMFDLIIVKAFLPLLATLVGFVLGTKVKSD